MRIATTNRKERQRPRWLLADAAPAKPPGPRRSQMERECPHPLRGRWRDGGKGGMRPGAGGRRFRVGCLADVAADRGRPRAGKTPPNQM